MQMNIRNASSGENVSKNRPLSGSYRGRIINIEEIAGNDQYQQSAHISIDWELEGFGRYRDRFHINDKDFTKAAKQQAKLQDLSTKVGIVPQGGSVESDQLLGKRAVIIFSSFLPKEKDHPYNLC
ncbi:hypothetical protein COB21_00505 [Candidatus Aerophobetes bacterium]|uniref:Uncharacterized protein n=1 Tax=Aerophobetes bacterium TaxID=2030807 RepID=A0A2A4X7N7_UNCAE|nr:MAG: hypothetical protein COB21_00505 [Candidatus Aerophobetes bacterium]